MVKIKGIVIYKRAILSKNHEKEQMFGRSKASAADMTNFSVLFYKVAPGFLIFVSLVLMMFHKVNENSVEKMKLAMIDAISPILVTASAPVSYTFEAIDNMINFSQLRTENIKLSNENQHLREWYEKALKLQAENQSLKELLNVKVDGSIKYVTARVIADAGKSFVKSVILPVGLEDNVKKGSAVMAGQGLVGRIAETGKRASRALLITDLNSRIPVVIQNTRAKAILAGKNKSLLKLERLPNDSGIRVGSRVVTSGDGGQIPAEIPIGVIVSVGDDGVWVEPLAEISKLTYVQVVNADVDQAVVTGNLAAE